MNETDNPIIRFEKKGPVSHNYNSPYDCKLTFQQFMLYKLVCFKHTEPLLFEVWLLLYTESEQLSWCVEDTTNESMIGGDGSIH